MKQYIGQMMLALTYEYHHIFAQKYINPESFISIFNEMCKFENRLFRCTTSFREELVPYKYDEKWCEAVDEHILGFGDDKLVIGDKDIPYPEKMINIGDFKDDTILLKYIVKQEIWIPINETSVSYKKKIFPTLTFPTNFTSSPKMHMIDSNDNSMYVIIISYNPKNNDFKQQKINLNVDRSGVSMISPDSVQTNWEHTDITNMDIIDIYINYPRIYKDLIENRDIGPKLLLKYIKDD